MCTCLQRFSTGRQDRTQVPIECGPGQFAQLPSDAFLESGYTSPLLNRFHQYLNDNPEASELPQDIQGKIYNAVYSVYRQYNA